jgi:4-hydroxy-tetrahydrodipicolinate reductase
MALVEQTAAKLDESWDLEILETHHRHKIDAPSGTALALSRAAEKGRGADSTLHTLHRQGRRESGSIGFAVRRGGDVAGEHCVSFYGPGERLELSHSASDRSLFARGALTAVPWLIQQKPGLYSMRDFLGF